ncbi:PorP/SprF family type IX secretion system membrane protein [Filimonas effusa]|uniref:Type IX secretion system membrane protein PorP/SprF n=1 Tax=Filimonas effusa TaxID=2508721 RepID=A0A4Q1DBF3_9BACT|nr:PorP/SprF family type IX secretion system membrane protein [Filimonas effusa]RXK85839.1 type IX secretion system membrane protein PorP/SprF [Filimonas effusa]
MRKQCSIRVRVVGGCLLLASLLVSSAELHAQVDPHFTQYYVYPSWLNPALTGIFDGKYRASAIYRNQWSNISSPFSTMGASLELTTEKNLNVGLSVLNQVAGDGGYNYTTAYGSVAYTGIRFGANETHRVVLGLQAGMIQRKFNPSKLVFFDQWNPVTGGMIPTQEMISDPSATAFDAGAGALYYDATPGKKANVFAGFSASHINQADNRFAAVINEKMPVRYTIHGGVKLWLNEQLSLTPHLLYLRQAKSEEKVIGAYAQLRATTATDLLLGLNCRLKDAFTPYVGVTHNNMVFSASYDVNTSDLGKMVKGTNSFEVTLTFFGRKKTKTPEVEFVCPRL